MIGAVVVVVILVGAVIAFVLASGDDEVNLTRSELQSALLTPEEVGPDFEESDPDDGDDTQYEASSECEELIAQFEQTDDQTDDAEAEVTRGDGELVLNHSLEPLDEEDPGIDEVRTALEACDEVAFTDAESEGTLAFEPESIQGIGEEATGAAIDFTITDEDESVTLEGYIVFFVRDGIGGSVTAVAGLDDAQNPLPVDVDLVRQTATKADEKLQRVIDES